jgi:iron complex outermembrane receptor protein
MTLLEGRHIPSHMIRERISGAAVGSAAALAACAAIAQGRVGGLFEMSIEELREVRVVSMSRRAEPLDQAAASIFVITAEDIRRAGVRSIPEALRLAPGVEVARNGASSWTISMRGFNSDLSNKLLVLIDGRSVYSPLFAGVFWDVQDTLLADVDRIEVIAGPGGSIWGANAVNGVINIITSTAEETQGGFVEVGGGARHGEFLGFRYGGSIDENSSGRFYIKHFDRASTQARDGGDAMDDWQMSQGGFNIGWDVDENDRMTFRGDIYDGKESALLRGDFTLGTLPDFNVPGTVEVAGSNLLGRWRRQLESEGGLRLQAYFDHTERAIPGSFDEERTTYDLDFQHDLPSTRRHRFAWGLGMRVTSDDIRNTLFATFEPASRTDRTLSSFLQDRISFWDGRLGVILGAKLEHNDYTGFEHQPSVRLTWRIDDRSVAWAAVSRAVRTPARLNTDLRLTAPIPNAGTPAPLYVNVSGSPDYQSEELLAYEAGYRLQVTTDLSFDVALFRNIYDHLQTQEVGALEVVGEPPAHILLPATLANGMQGDSHGGTLIVNWQTMPRWRFQVQYAYLDLDFALKPQSTDVNGLDLAGNSPRHQLALYSFAELPHGWSSYLGARYVDALPSQGIDSYIAADANLEWRPSDDFSASFTVQNLNDRRHLEFGDGTFIERSAYIRLSWMF